MYGGMYFLMTAEIISLR